MGSGKVENEKQESLVGWVRKGNPGEKDAESVRIVGRLRTRSRNP